jgi:hypothetical protein
MNLKDIYRLFHSEAKEYIVSSATHRTYSKIGNILGHKIIFNKYKKTEIIYCLLSGYIEIKFFKLQKISKHMEAEQFTLE